MKDSEQYAGMLSLRNLGVTMLINMRGYQFQMRSLGWELSRRTNVLQKEVGHWAQVNMNRGKTVSTTASLECQKPASMPKARRGA